MSCSWSCTRWFESIESVSDQLQLFAESVAPLTAYPPLWVCGTPEQKGSQQWGAQAWIDKKTGKLRCRAFPDDKNDRAVRSKNWERKVAIKARDWWGARMPLEGSVALDLLFYFERPLSHYRSGKYSRDLKPGMPLLQTGTPDSDKVARNVCDALKGTVLWPKGERDGRRIIYRDDSQANPVLIRKHYACRHTGGEGVEIRIYA